MKALTEMTPEEIQAYIGELEEKNSVLETDKLTLQAEKDKIAADAQEELKKLKTELKKKPGEITVKIDKTTYKVISPSVTLPKSITGNDSKSIKAADLVKDTELCKKLIEKGSGVLVEA